MKIICIAMLFIVACMLSILVWEMAKELLKNFILNIIENNKKGEK